MRSIVRYGQHGAGQSALGIILGIVLLALLTLAFRSIGFVQTPYSVALTMIIPVLVIASQYGWVAGIIVSLIAALTFNFFFIEPYYSVFISSGADVIGVAVFLITAVVTSQLAARARQQRAAAEAHASETAALNVFNQAVLAEGGEQPIMQRVVQQAALHTLATLTALYVSDPGSSALHAVARYPDIVGPTPFTTELVQYAFSRKITLYDRVNGQGRAAYMPLLRGDSALGVLALLLPEQGKAMRSIFSSDSQRWLGIIANQAALAVDHARLTTEAAQVVSLKEADKVKSALLASVSHELRTPLTTIKTAVAGLSDASIEFEPGEQREYLAMIDTEADRLTRLIANLLDLSRLEAGTLKPQTGLHYLPEIVSITQERLERSGVLAQNSVTTDFAPDLPLVSVDYVQIEQVITNLLENAAKYSPVGKPISVSVRKAPHPTSNTPGIVVAVSDEGIGIPEAERTRIFDTFYRVHGSDYSVLSSQPSGTGLGLAICKGIIEAHGGTIWAQPRLLGGTTFAFWLPLTHTLDLPGDI